MPSPLLPVFIALSQSLTGFDGLGSDPGLAQTYLDRLAAKHGDPIDSMLQAIQAVPGQALPDTQVESILKDAVLGPIARDIIVLWYNTTLDGIYGTPGNNQYVYGLTWQAVQAHPMGYAVENVPFYWQYQPDGGKYTGANSGRRTA